MVTTAELFYSRLVTRDADAELGFHLTREGGHSARRIIHAADATGHAVQATLEQKVRSHPNITLLEQHVAVDLIRLQDAPRPLFGGIDRERSARLMAALDAVNARFGRGTLVPAAAGLKRPWSTRFDRRSPRYTTRLD